MGREHVRTSSFEKVERLSRTGRPRGVELNGLGCVTELPGGLTCRAGAYRY